MTEKNKVESVKRVDFGSAISRIQQFDAIVPSDLSEDQLEDRNLWALVAGQIKPGAEIRVVAADYSFVGTLFVTFVNGTDVRTRLISYSRFEVADEQDETVEGDYMVKLCGVKRFCIIKRDDGTVIKENIATKKEAYRDLDDYLRALAA